MGTLTARIADASKDAVALEDLVDRHSLSAVVMALSTLAYAKAQHLEENWQDRGSAELWEHAGRKLDAVAVRVTGLGL